MNKFLKSPSSVIATILGLALLFALVWFAYVAFISHRTLVKLPMLNNVFIVKNIDDNGETLFNAYLSYMQERGFDYLPEERTGGIIWFEKDGKKYDMSYPTFKFISR